MNKKRKMNLLEDIKDIVKNDKEHHLKIEVDCVSVKVFLIYDPENDYSEDMIIPIEYCIFDEFAYISDSEYREMFKPCDYGLTLDEVTLIKNIMEYLESHKKEIKDLCQGYSWEDRMEKENE